MLTTKTRLEANGFRVAFQIGNACFEYVTDDLENLEELEASVMYRCYIEGNCIQRAIREIAEFQEKQTEIPYAPVCLVLELPQVVVHTRVPLYVVASLVDSEEVETDDPGIKSFIEYARAERNSSA